MLSASARQSRELMYKLREHCEALARSSVECRHGNSESRLDDMTTPRATRSSIESRLNKSRLDKSWLNKIVFRTMELILPDGVRIILLPANPMTVRGFTADIFLDEFAMHRDSRAIWSAMLPTLLRGQG